MPTSTQTAAAAVKLPRASGAAPSASAMCNPGRHHSGERARRRAAGDALAATRRREHRVLGRVDKLDP
ncbi:hypothetical protein GCM10009416_03550 [Craurococcus roseus]|uniref:Uncharacterized protein n=1 Tax=Craurococcus roseus TaxID=77585 RepID=A0ABP3PJR1_9PROT